MANNWTDANIRNHVSSENKYRIERFYEEFIFSSGSSKQYYPFILEDIYAQPNVIYKSFNYDKFDKYISVMKEKAAKYTFASTSDSKALQDAKFSFTYIYLYQLILYCNNLTTMLDYDSSNLPKVLMPTKSNIETLFKDLLKDSHHKNVKELTKAEDIEEAVRQVIVNADQDHELADAISELINIDNVDNIVKRLNSPLIQKYLSRQIYYLLYHIEAENEDVLINTLHNWLKKITKFVIDTSNSED